jgi:DNA-binding transcriptional ArsR family regulator
MMNGPSIANVGALMGDPARSIMLTSLMSGQALTASELAYVAGVAAATASGHLAQLLDGGLLAVEKQGRHRYYRLAGPEVASAIEALMDLAEQSGQRSLRPGPRDSQMRRARVCYDHLAGECGVELFTRLTRRKLIMLDEGAVTITSQGERQFAEFGIDVAALRAGKRPICRYLPRLERAPLASCRCAWGSTASSLIRPRMGPSRQRFSRNRVHTARRGELRAALRVVL